MCVCACVLQRLLPKVGGSVGLYWVRAHIRGSRCTGVYAAIIFFHGEATTFPALRFVAKDLMDGLS